MSAAFFNDFHTNTFAGNATGYKKDPSLITSYGVASIGKVCQFNIDAHNHLGGHLHSRGLRPCKRFDWLHV